MNAMVDNGSLRPTTLGNTSMAFGDGVEDLEKAGTPQPTPLMPTVTSTDAPVPGLLDPARNTGPLKDTNGAPALARPTMNFSPEDLIAALESLRNQSLKGQEANALGRVEKSRIDSKKANESQQAKIKEWSADCEKAAKAERRAKIFGWIGKIAAFLAAGAAVVATVATAGAASPLLAVAAIGLASATLAVIDQGVKDLGGSERGFSMSVIFGKPMEWILCAAGIDKEKAVQIGLVVAGAIGIASGGLPILIDPQLLGEMSKGICQLAGASEKTTMGVTMGVGLAATVTVGIIMAVVAWKLPPAESVSKIGQVFTGAGTQMLQGSTQMAQGGNMIARAVYEANATGKVADKKLLEALMVEFQRAMEISLDDLRKIIQQLQKAVEAVSSMINSFVESSVQIVTNLNKSPV
ncbi:MAG: type III secretion system translocon subunit SctE [Ottowia sp.]|uniref:type III secretion system translocon subunit SctE n=1 Tax=Ottowia sp. TaxID=1898956 RepID=UPI003C722014